jgi:hypothetical protein
LDLTRGRERAAQAKRLTPGDRHGRKPSAQIYYALLLLDEAQVRQPVAVLVDQALLIINRLSTTLGG